MVQHIDKNALLVKINNLKHKIDDRYSYSNGWKDALRMVEAELNSLEVKDVDLEREIDEELKTRWMGEYLNTEKFYESAKHFFELGLKSQKRK